MSRYFTATLLAAVVASSAFSVSAADHHSTIERAFKDAASDRASVSETQVDRGNSSEEQRKGLPRWWH
ncbi:hypothetical protein PSm6_53670 [Pseudomonas solani]|uniref:Uncharacterized protein n=1 Tax=Pseudomonas solani TaxID=2731552 RepID=A0AAU7YB97_9PSED|nr:MULTISPECIES: hypothetical protein [Pseudomonas]MCU9947662.1 hypothetical protein [Pseudomonas sp. PDM13]BCD88960.1 hypothetical protein PSm6_53670 [Pseudomonas solani]